MSEAMGFSHFMNHLDTVGRVVLAILIVMSVATWFLILQKSIEGALLKIRSRRFLRAFWNAPNLGSVRRFVQEKGVSEPFGHLTHHGLRAQEHFENRTGERLMDAGSADEFLTRALRRAIEQDTARLEKGQTLLASVGSAAPFVGLFGTVWSIYRALIGIATSGAGTLDKVAGPVGEALIMTALGLAVAIPAVLAYNFFTRRNRLLLAELDGFAHDLFTFMSTGARDTTQAPSKATLKPAPMVAQEV
ncbi:MAG: MotA/TolQ/ExbB proton channel family protein [Thiotrichales bacterium]